MRAKAIVIAAMILLLISLVVINGKRRAAEQELNRLSVQLQQLQGNPQQNQEQANKILAKVKKHIVLDDKVQPTVAAIIDVKKLREQNPFYNKAENGDFLIVTQTRAVLYDPDKDMILDVAPVQLQQPAAPAQK
ncbi:MAG: Uncharacterized protein G01um101425_965 [Candidatus Peregrinibacteria bacterium Gr01-1014_25]|nr:MAG: Uncharacterized protein G01um101425_965 [Candidatus Peregrinibacteria bacterium Gr01-1014_25]